MDENVSGGLSAAEEAYFTSGGEALPVQEPEPKQEADSGQQEGLQAEAEGLTQQEQQTERDDRGRFVSHGAFHAEREEHKKTKAERDEYREKWARMEERFAAIQSANQQASAIEQVDGPPDGDDPIAKLEWTAGKLQSLEKTFAERQQAEQEQQQFAAVYRTVDQKFRQAEEADPSGSGAYAYARESYANVLRAFGMPAPMIEQQLQAYVKQFVSIVASQGQNPGEFAKQLAAARGWRQQSQAPAAAAPTAAEKIDKIATAQEASRTVGAASGRSGGDEVTLESILSMPADEFAQWQGVPANQRIMRKLMGA